MSTKISLTHGQSFHLYSEMFDEKCIYLALKDVKFEATNDGVTVAIPLPIWETIRAHTNAEFSFSDMRRKSRLNEIQCAARTKIAIAPPPIPVGKIKSFGPFGPKYEVGQALRQLDDGDWMIEVTMIETGEKAEYRWTHLSDDPETH